MKRYIFGYRSGDEQAPRIIDTEKENEEEGVLYKRGISDIKTSCSWNMMMDIDRDILKSIYSSLKVEEKETHIEFGFTWTYNYKTVKEYDTLEEALQNHIEEFI